MESKFVQCQSPTCGLTYPKEEGPNKCKKCLSETGQPSENAQMVAEWALSEHGQKVRAESYK